MSIHMPTGSAAMHGIGLALVLAASAMTSQVLVAQSNTVCLRECLLQRIAEFKAAALAKKPISIGQNAEVRENMVVTTVEESAWKDVKAVRSSMAFADALTGNVVSRDGVELTNGRAGYISTRLKIAAGHITEVEFSSDVTGAREAYVWSLPASLTAVVPAAGRPTRESLDALARRSTDRNPGDPRSNSASRSSILNTASSWASHC